MGARLAVFNDSDPDFGKLSGSPATRRQAQRPEVYVLKLTLITLILLPVVTTNAADPVFPYGAVYFRSRTRRRRTGHETIRPPRNGMNNFRHWLMWSAIEVAPDKYDWRDYDRMMDLAAKNGIKVTIAEMITAAPGVDVRQIRARTLSWPPTTAWFIPDFGLQRNRRISRTLPRQRGRARSGPSISSPDGRALQEPSGDVGMGPVE